MELSAAELDCLIVSLQLREDSIRVSRGRSDSDLHELPPEIIDACLVELAALRAKLTAELDRIYSG